MKIELRAWMEHWNRRITITGFARDGDRRDKIKEIIWEKITPENEFSVNVNAEIHIAPTEAQQLMDDLWQCGLRPSEGTGSAGALAATQKHLEDMRTIAFKTLGHA